MESCAFGVLAAKPTWPGAPLRARHHADDSHGLVLVDGADAAPRRA